MDSPGDEVDVEGGKPPIAKAVEAWHALLPPWAVRRLQVRLRGLAAQEPVTVGTACSGTDIVMSVFDVLTSFYESMYDIKVKARSSFACDSDKDLLMPPALSRYKGTAQTSGCIISRALLGRRRQH